jgi:hypothetical protein
MNTGTYCHSVARQPGHQYERQTAAHLGQLYCVLRARRPGLILRDQYEETRDQ